MPAALSFLQMIFNNFLQGKDYINAKFKYSTYSHCSTNKYNNLSFRQDSKLRIKNRLSYAYTILAKIQNNRYSYAMQAYH